MKPSRMVLVGCFLVAFCVAGKPESAPVPLQVVEISGRIYELEIAATPETRRQGLMHRTSLAFDGGMVFVFCATKVQTFWMKNTLVDLDIVFLDEDGRIVSFLTMAAAPRHKGESEQSYEERLKRYGSDKSARYAIEFMAGTTELLKLKKGTVIPLDFKLLGQLAEPDGE